MSDPGSLYDGEDEDLSMLVPEMRDAYDRLKRSELAANVAMEKNVYGPQRAMWDQYRKDLEQRRAGPSAAENLLSIGAALAQPTKYRGFSGMLANVAPVLAEQQKASRAAEDAKRELLMKYGMEAQKLTLAQKQAEIEAGRALDKDKFKALLEQYRIAHTPKWMTVDLPDGGKQIIPLMPGSAPQSPPAVRPPGVPANWTFEQDANGNSAWVSPDRKQHVEVK